MEIKRLKREDAILTAVDFQEKLLPAMSEPGNIEKLAVKLAKGLRELGIPAIVTQQYTKGIGKTVDAVAEAIGEFEPVEKNTFSAWLTDEYRKKLTDSCRKSVILMGVETHICVEQTALDLLANGYEVFLAADCVGSRDSFNRDNSIRRMERAGAVITNAESILYELMGSSAVPEFKAISKIVK